ELGLTDRRVIVYLGALGGCYLTDEMARFLAIAHRRDRSTFAMILTQSPPALISKVLRRLGIGEGDYFVRQIAPTEIPRYLLAADLALCFIKPSYSKAASSPTKVAEYLASGLPIVCNAGIGDLDGLIEGEGVGVLVREFGDAHFRRALDGAEALISDCQISSRCRTAAAAHFDLESVGGERYRGLYQRLSVGIPHRPVKLELSS
ncbi:MAG TPA: hypothetical protein VGZ22_27145, partial [Isosphaeraceae bacterium]|nr:hypothetical protein [Isosphaeraceae bacterium]